MDILVEIPFFFFLFSFQRHFQSYRRERFHFSSLFVREIEIEIEIGRKLWEKRKRERKDELAISTKRGNEGREREEAKG